MERKTFLLVGIVLTFMLACATALEDEKLTKPMPRFIRKLFRQLFEEDKKLKEKREIAEPQSESKGWYEVK